MRVPGKSLHLFSAEDSDGFVQIFGGIHRVESYCNLCSLNWKKYMGRLRSASILLLHEINKYRDAASALNDAPAQRGVHVPTI